MQSFNITNNDAGQTLFKYVSRILKEAPSGLLHKQIRNKNITLNGKKCEGNEKLAAGDEVKIFMSDDTIAKFRGNTKLKENDEYSKALSVISDVKIIYSDSDIYIADKPVGVLSQKSTPTDVSVNEWLIGFYLKNEPDAMAKCVSSGFTPSICNRLDRNTGGLITFGKTLKGARFLNEVIRNRTVRKFYTALVKGEIKDSSLLKGYLYKDEKTNKVTLKDLPFEGADYVETSFKPVKYSSKYNITELEVELITGKTHQIRAHLSSIGHPIIGDAKYGDPLFNEKFKREFKLKNQFLYACRMEFPVDCEHEPLRGKTVSIDLASKLLPYFD